MNDFALVRPAVAGLCRVNFLARHEPHSRRTDSHFGTAIVHAIFTTDVVDIGGPNVDHVRGVGVKPFRKLGHGRLAVLPVQSIFGELHEHVVVRGRKRVAVLVTDNVRVMPRPAGFLSVPIGGKSRLCTQSSGQSQNGFLHIASLYPHITLLI